MIPIRAWNKATKVMHEADDIVSLNFEEKQFCVKTLFFGQLSYYDFDDIVLMQSTGLKDKNGKDIFEGDIITNGIDIMSMKRHGTLGFYAEKKGEIEFISGSADLEDFEDDAKAIADSLEVIGNIYENPELLK